MCGALAVSLWKCTVRKGEHPDTKRICEPNVTLPRGRRIGWEVASEKRSGGVE